MLRAKAQPGDEDYFDLSFSGLKTAVRLAVQAAVARDALEAEAPSIARGFQEAVVETLAVKVRRAMRARGRARVVLGGGVACNRALQGALAAVVAERPGGALYAPSPRLATDNAAMIAAAGIFRLAQGERASPTLTAQATLPLPGMFRA
jgi:N6-L-threonylcarbamoyladenine synthase